MSAFPDKHIKAIIQDDRIRGSPRLRSEAIIDGLKKLWKFYGKEFQYVTIFQAFVDFERNIEAIASEYASHVDHVFHVFLFGYNILMSSKYIKEKYKFAEGRNGHRSYFGELFFSWMVASLLHDVGYDVEKAPEEEKFRERKNEFWDFITPRETTEQPLGFATHLRNDNVNLGMNPGHRIMEDILYEEMRAIQDFPRLTYDRFEELFLRNVPGRRGWKRYDHGLISAIKYLIEVAKLQGSLQGPNTKWRPNRNAALAMALHNFRYKKCNLQLSIENPRTIVAYLLIVCDEIQEWEKERYDEGIELSETTELRHLTFGNNQAVVMVNHKPRGPKDPKSKEILIEDLSTKIKDQKADYPIRVLDFDKEYDFVFIGELMEKEIKELLMSTYQMSEDFVKKKLKEIKENIDKATYGENAKLLELSTSIKQTNLENNLLKPSERYKIKVLHLVDMNPFATIEFPL